jgi:large subunit ribosomal protein L6e
MPRVLRNPLLVKGLRQYSAVGTRHKRQLRAEAKAKASGKEVQPPVEKPKKERKVKVKPFGKNGQTRTIQRKFPRVYPDEPIRHKIKRPANWRKRPGLRKSITPGTVLIILSGRYKTKRVVFLKQLGSGLLLVTGPFKLNGVPIRRINQAYVIATKTKIDLGDFKVESRINDRYFKKTDKKQKARAEMEKKFFEGKKNFNKEMKKKASARGGKAIKHKKARRLGPAGVPDYRKEDQKNIDKVVLKAIRKTDPFLRRYLKARFSLKKGQYPHTLKF